MIQRLQSIFLFLASAIGLTQFAVPYASTTQAAADVPALADGVFNPFDNIGLIGLVALSAVVSLIAIFLYRNRPLQFRFTGLAALATILLIALIGFQLSRMLPDLSPENVVRYQAGLALPVVALALLWLAGRYIKKDEALVRSADRLR